MRGHQAAGWALEVTERHQRQLSGPVSRWEGMGASWEDVRVSREGLRASWAGGLEANREVGRKGQDRRLGVN